MRFWANDGNDKNVEADIIKSCNIVFADKAKRTQRWNAAEVVQLFMLYFM